MINLEVSDRQQLIALLKELPELATERSRQQILQLAGLGELAPRIDLGGQTLIAVSEIVSYLSKYGRISTGEEALALFLKTLKDYTGIEQQEFLNKLLSKYEADEPITSEKSRDNAKEAQEQVQEKTVPTSQKMPDSDKIPRIFICYAHKDNESQDPSKRYLSRLLEQLEPLNLQEQADIWSDEKIELGSDWHNKIQGTLEQAQAAIFLVSPAFLASRYIRNSELPVLLKNAQDKGVIIIPIILRKCLFRETVFKYPNPKNGPEQLSLSVFQAPTSKPINSLPEHEQDDVFCEVAKRIFQIVNPPYT